MFAVSSGRVLVGGAPAEKASRLVSAADPLVVLGPGPRFVSRGGDKLEAALSGFGVDVAGRRALDAGSSTGGFVDCLLQWGAAEVIAIDVGRGQLAATLRADPRVRLHEGAHVGRVGPEVLAPGGPVDLVTADLSFISLRAVAGALVGFLVPEGELVVLVKPQFEAGRVEASRAKGVIRDPLVWRAAIESAVTALSDAGTGIIGMMASPLRGAAGNVEYFVHARRGAEPPAPDAVGAMIEEAVSGATGEA